MNWKEVDEAVNIFDAPPATANGNIFNVNDPDEKVLGYFETAAADTARFYITRFDLPFVIRNPCERPGPRECTNCDAFDNSSRERPWYWLEE